MARLFFVVQQAPQPPFWWDPALSPATLVYAATLALVGAVMVGVVPDLKATGGALQPRLGTAAAGANELRFGGMWTVIIVLQVALSVAFLPLAVSQAGAAFQGQEVTAFPAERYLTAQLGRDAAVPPRTAEEEEAFEAAAYAPFQEVRERVAAGPAVEGVALASGLSGMNHVLTPVEFVGDDAASPVAGRVRVLLVDPAYLELMGASVVAGRPLGSADLAPGGRSAVVNVAFAERFLGGRNAVGGRFRFPEREGEASVVTTPAAGTSLEVVGVVQDPGIDLFGPGAHPAIHAPLDLAPVTPRAVGLVGMPQGERLAAWVFMVVAGMVLMLSVAGISALMSFTVTRRTREIAIRAAVGARQGQIVGIVFRRAFLQLLAGVALGGVVAVPVISDGIADNGPRTLILVATLLLGAGLAACLVPVRRELAIQPAAAMKAG